MRPGRGAANMALDEAAMELAREGRFVFRTYLWRPECVSLGRNQPTGESLGGRPTGDMEPGRDVVRRPSGGRAVYHGPEITYAFVAPERALGGPRAIYRAVHDALRTALVGLGVPVDPPLTRRPREPDDAHGRRKRGVSLTLDECFVSPGPDELTVGRRKLVGSAQWRNSGAVLQHGSILIRNRQSMATVDGGGGRGAIGLGDLGPVPARSEIVDAIVAALADRLEAETEHTAIPRDVVRDATTLARRYDQTAWTWRR